MRELEGMLSANPIRTKAKGVKGKHQAQVQTQVRADNG
jgi:hypothetical protein